MATQAKAAGKASAKAPAKASAKAPGEAAAVPEPRTEIQEPAAPPGVSLGALVLVLALVALVAGWGFVLWHHRFRPSASAVMLMLGWAAVVSSVYFLWRTADNADLDDEEDWWKPTGELDELVREKKALLRSIKEAELDRDTGKLSAEDAAEMIQRYRAQAIEVIKAIEAKGGEAGADGDVRARIEREVRARVEIDRGADRKAKDKKAARPAEPAPEPEPAEPAPEVVAAAAQPDEPEARKEEPA